MNITQFLNSSGYYQFEEHSQGCPEQVIDLINLT
jgi:hypothetical protein